MNREINILGFSPTATPGVSRLKNPDFPTFQQKPKTTSTTPLIPPSSSLLIHIFTIPSHLPPFLPCPPHPEHCVTPYATRRHQQTNTQRARHRKKWALKKKCADGGPSHLKKFARWLSARRLSPNRSHSRSRSRILKHTQVHRKHTKSPLKHAQASTQSQTPTADPPLRSPEPHIRLPNTTPWHPLPVRMFRRRG